MNRLQYETSPYLIQHASNPVDWYPWGDEAFEKAKTEDKPILLSIGYSACHWCHVMEHESFANPETAALMNEHFVSIKVDREERPDVDDIYMQATLIFTGGHGGWPMTVFLTPEGRPYHAGTYFPPVPRHGMPSFPQVLMAAMDAYQNRRDQLEQLAQQVTESLQTTGKAEGQGNLDALNSELVSDAARKLTARPDRIYGGLHTGQPKFPSPMNLEFLLRYTATSDDQEMLDIVTFTLKKMAQGGIYDQIGGGFHRYSVDNRWLVPHFEKMLYDNAQLARVYLHAYQITKDPFFETIVHDILGYVEREMVDNTLGEELLGFYSTQDADSEGEEGKFFVWTTEEVRDVLQMDFSDAEIRFVLDYYGIIAEGNFEGKSIPNIEHDLGDVARNHDISHSIAEDTIQRARQLLFEVRESRIKPARDEKMLAAWNGMMLAIFAEAGRVFGDSNYVDIARRNGEFLLTRLSNDKGNLYRTFKNDDQGGHAKLDGYLEDYANVIDGLIELYQTTFDPHWFSEAQRLTDHVIMHFRNQDGGFFDTSDQHPAMIARPRSVQDNATPSGNNLMAFNLLRMAAYTGQSEYEIVAEECLAGLTSAMREYPSAFGVALSALHFYSSPVVEVAVLSPRDNDELEAIFSLLIQPFRPTMVMAFAEENQSDKAIPQLLAHRVIRDNQPTVYVCRNFVCDVPVATVGEVATLLKS